MSDRWRLRGGLSQRMCFGRRRRRGVRGAKMSVDWLPDDNGRVAKLGGRSDTSLMRNI
jgi:hypothetical protein